MLKIKSILLVITMIISSFVLINNTFAECNSLANFNECMWKAKTVIKTTDMKIESWFKEMIYKWVKNIWWILGLFAVAMIAYGWLTLVISTWDDEKIKKWKDIVKWWMLWFLWLVSAWALITIVINIMFTLGENVS